MTSNLPNLRRLFVEARSEAEENAYSRSALECDKSACRLVPDDTRRRPPSILSNSSGMMSGLGFSGASDWSLTDISCQSEAKRSIE
ncbi:hypothetical protein IWX90DRAFT_63315 [Phyllosticta citrichinensis]|uniref:Uncharacterized protein n=1 Tax=Phyllosticta citrichinensis TaxID=1130410 RepID=A0ABR1XH83_9PEZI